jgi:CelD/BcsL family acetyltransferase involved in cellulose biosynthesis
MLTWLGGELTDYQGPIIGKAGGTIGGREFADLWAKVIEKIDRFDIVYFFNQPKRIFKLPNPFIEFSTRPNAARYYGVITKGVPYYKNTLPKKIQQDTRRQVNRLMSLGSTTFVVAENMSERERITQILLEQKQRKYRETGAKDIFLNEAYRKFYNDLSTSTQEKKIVHISALYVGEAIVATHWGMTWRGKYYYLLPGYASGKWQQFSPGRILLKYLVDWSESNGDHIFDFTVGSEVYKSQWANRKEHVYEYIKPFSWRGNLFVFLRQLSRAISGRKDSVES